MAHRMWLLVEWMDERDVFPSYGIVNVGSLIGIETQLHVGKIIFVGDTLGHSSRRARILMMSDNKKYVKEQKKSMERERHQVKNVLSSCLRQLSDMSSNRTLGLMGPSQQYQPGPSSSTAITVPRIVADSDDSSSSDSELHFGRRHNTPVVPQNTHYNREATLNGRRGLTQTPAFTSRFIMCSTPVSEMNPFGSHSPMAPNPINGSQTPKLTFDQGTQTDPVRVPTVEQMSRMEVIVKELYRHFVKLVVSIEGNCNGSPRISSSMQPAIDNVPSDTSTIEPMESEPEHGRRSSPEQVVSDAGEHSGENLNGSVAEAPNARVLQVRRVSAQTTNQPDEPNTDHCNEMVPIGFGNTVVPRRMLNDIDWTSYSTATRQLLQAVFPRRVLATHSLTGKQSPAFANKPPKKRLNPQVVNDIVETVAERCGVAKSLVRYSITIKCTDEAKLFRNRQQLRRARLENQNQENVPPSSPSSDESTLTE